MKKGYLCSDKIQKTMKSKLLEQLTIFLDRRSHNWQQRLCLITFLMLTLSVIVAGVPMHIAGLVGRGSNTLYVISVVMWLATVMLLALYLLRHISLRVAISIARPHHLSCHGSRPTHPDDNSLEPHQGCGAANGP